MEREVNENEEQNVNTEGVDNAQEVSEDKTFNLDAFISGGQNPSDSTPEVDNEASEVTTEEPSSQEETIGDSDELDWTALISDETEESSTQEDPVEAEVDSSSETQEEATTEEVTEESSFDFGGLSKDLGVDIKSVDDLKQYISDKDKELEEARNLNPAYLTDKAKSLREMKNLDDLDLYTKNLMAQGLPLEKAQSHARKAKEDGSLAREADIVRANIDRAVDQEIHQARESEAKAARDMEQQALDNKKMLKEVI